MPVIQEKIGIDFGKNKTIKGEWDEFRQKVFGGIKPSEIKPSETQIDEMRKAFYAGFYSCLAVAFELGELDEEAGTEALENLKIECEEFFKKQLADYLKSKN